MAEKLPNRRVDRRRPGFLSDSQIAALKPDDILHQVAVLGCIPFRVLWVSPDDPPIRHVARAVTADRQMILFATYSTPNIHLPKDCPHLRAREPDNVVPLGRRR